MERCGDEHARFGHGIKRGHDIRRIKRLAGPQRAPPDQTQQNQRFEAEHMLRWDGADQTHGAGKRQLLHGGLDVPHQLAPGFVVGHRQAGRTGSKYLCRHMLGFDLTRFTQETRRLPIPAMCPGKMGVGKRPVFMIVQTKRIGCIDKNLP